MSSKEQRESAPNTTELARAIDEIRLEVDFLSGALVALYERVEKLINEELPTPSEQLGAYQQALAVRYLIRKQSERKTKPIARGTIEL